MKKLGLTLGCLLLLGSSTVLWAADSEPAAAPVAKAAKLHKAVAKAPAKPKKKRKKVSKHTKRYTPKKKKAPLAKPEPKASGTADADDHIEVVK